MEEGRRPSREKCSSATLPYINATWIVVMLKHGLRSKILRINRRDFLNGPEIFWYCERKSQILVIITDLQR